MSMWSKLKPKLSPCAPQPVAPPQRMDGSIKHSFDQNLGSNAKSCCWRHCLLAPHQLLCNGIHEEEGRAAPARPSACLPSGWLFHGNFLMEEGSDRRKTEALCGLVERGKFWVKRQKCRKVQNFSFARMARWKPIEDYQSQ